MASNFSDISGTKTPDGTAAPPVSKREKQNPKKAKSTAGNEGYKTKECKVIGYNKRTGTLDIMFDKYGIRIKDIKDFSGGPAVTVKYKGEIGCHGFECRL